MIWVSIPHIWVQWIIIYYYITLYILYVLPDTKGGGMFQLRGKIHSAMYTAKFFVLQYIVPGYLVEQPPRTHLLRPALALISSEKLMDISGIVKGQVKSITSILVVSRMTAFLLTSLLCLLT